MNLHQHVHVIGHDHQRHHPPAMPTGLRPDQLLTLARDPASQDRAAIPRAPQHVISGAAQATTGHLHFSGHAGDYTHRLCQTTRLRCRPKTAIPSRGA
jgi:hypothetical protein